MRPTFQPTTHDILTPYVQRGGFAAFSIRVVLVATGAPIWGIYSDYELVENVVHLGAEEQINDEKCGFKVHDYTPGEGNGIPHLLGNLNRIRRDHPAPQHLCGLVISPASNEKILSFTHFTRPEEIPSGKFDAVIMILSLDPCMIRDTLVYLDLTPFDVNPRWDAGPILRIAGELSEQTFL